MYSNKRKVCEFCHEELSFSAYYRHRDNCRMLNNRSVAIPNAKYPQECGSEADVQSSEEDSDVCVPSADSSGTDSSFCLDRDSSSSMSDVGDIDGPGMDVEPQDSEPDISSSSSESDATLPSDDNEIWDVSDSDGDANDSNNDANHSTSTIIRAISIFISMFHLTFRLPEKAIVTLLAFLRTLFSYLASLCQPLSLLAELATSLPRSVCGIRKYLKHSDEYVVYVVCPRCAKLYHLQDCIINFRGNQESKRCDHIEYPHHRHSNKRTACNTILLKRVKIGGKFKLVPRKTFVYRSIIKAIQMMLVRENFLQKCEEWRSRNIEEGVLGDVYDGKVWKDLHTIVGRPFLALPGNLCFTLNIDWFNPFDETQYSAGAIYLVVLNLPRCDRYKVENTILVGIIPGPSEPKVHINTYLSPMVDDICKLYDGHVFCNPRSLTNVTTMRAMLACITCDLPATRKVCGFSNFNATLGCSKCLKKFPVYQFGKKPDYSGFNVQTWVLRDMDTHMVKAIESKNANSTSHREEIAKTYGVKYSELLRLPEFNMVRYHVIDPMHNVFLGIIKHTVKTWKETGLLLDRHFEKLQEKVDLMNVPSKIGRIPRKIGAGFAAFTADEWKHWVLIYSVYALYDILPEEHYKCWCMLVDSCLHLCQPVTTLATINRAHDLIVEFCRTFETLYGRESCTANMHMACHLKASIEDYGPLSSFWCFPFERYNGILEGIKKSWLNPEKQMFLKYLDLQLMRQFTNSEHNMFVSDICKEYMMGNSASGSSSLAQTGKSDVIIVEQLKNISCPVVQIDATKKSFHYLVPPFKEKCFCDTEVAILEHMYSLLYPTSIVNFTRFYFQYKKLVINNEEFLCENSLSKRSSTIAAKWPGVLCVDPSGEAPLRVAQVHAYIEHNVVLNKNGETTSLPHVLAKVSWYMDHPKRDHLRSTVTICSTTFDSVTSASFLPVARIAGRCAIAKSVLKFDYGEDTVNIIVPLSKNIPLSSLS